MSAALQLLMDAAVGRDCILCLGHADEGLVCRACTDGLPRAAPSPRAIAVFDYRFPLDALMHRFKFAGDLAIGHWLALQLARRVREEPRPDMLVAPPLTPERLRHRGFNQSVEIARVVARAIEVPVAHRVLRKVRETAPQQGLGRRARRANLRGAFRCDRPLDGKRVAIVDDVFTTGTTAAALETVLRAAGAASVVTWTVASASPPVTPGTDHLAHQDRAPSGLSPVGAARCST